MDVSGASLGDVKAMSRPLMLLTKIVIGYWVVDSMLAAGKPSKRFPKRALCRLSAFIL